MVVHVIAWISIGAMLAVFCALWITESLYERQRHRKAMQALRRNHEREDTGS